MARNYREIAEPGCFDGPKQREIVAVSGQEFLEPIKIERLDLAASAPVLERVPSLGTSQPDGVALPVAEIMMVA
jgi:hypothetical protein